MTPSSPRPAAAHADPLVLLLRQRERAFASRLVGMFALGLPLSLAAPFLLSLVVWFIHQFFVTRPYAWTPMFLVAMAVVVPMLVWMEFRTAGEHLSSAVAEEYRNEDGEIAVPDPVFDLAFYAAATETPSATMIGLIDFVLFGPRLMVSAWRQWRLTRRFRHVSLVRAAEVLRRIKTSGASAVDTASLLNENEPPAKLMPTLGYLIFHEWIGLGQAGSRLWISSDSRKLVT